MQAVRSASSCSALSISSGAHAVEVAREGVPLKVIHRQLDHANLGSSS